MVKRFIVSAVLIIVIIIPVIIYLFLQNKKGGSGERFGFVRNASSIEEEKIKDTGATWFRPNFGFFAWGAMQKDANAPIDFSKTDELVRNTQKEGLNLLITLFPFADWDQKSNGERCKVLANDGGLPQKKGDFETPGLPYYRCNPVNWAAYQKWLTAVVKRYHGDVLYYEIGNEPDLTLGQDPKNTEGTVYYLDSPEHYAELLQKTYMDIKSANSDAQVLIAAPAGVQPQFQKFWQGVFSIPKIADYFDIGNMHCISAPNQDKNDPTSVSAADLNVTFYKNLLSNYKISKPIWITEAENIQGNNVEENVARLKDSVANALKNGAGKIFFTGASFSNDPMRYTSEIFIGEKDYYKNIISSAK